MKKLLLLLFLIPNLVMAESFYLVCDGIEEFKGSDGEINKIKKSIGIEVLEDTLILGGIYFTKKPNDLLNYSKERNRITFNMAEFHEDKIKMQSQGDIDRVSGQISYEQHFLMLNTDIYFDGICKTGDKAF
tara:strand:+ start:64 stop:456 length:393 start_codon:yes stop_codon:yes gene_type:complete